MHTVYIEITAIFWPFLRLRLNYGTTLRVLIYQIRSWFGMSSTWFQFHRSFFDMKVRKKNRPFYIKENLFSLIKRSRFIDHRVYKMVAKLGLRWESNLSWVEFFHKRPQWRTVWTKWLSLSLKHSWDQGWEKN